MTLKLEIFVFVLVVILNLSLGDPSACANPSTAKFLVHQEQVHVDAPSSGRVEKTIIVPSDKVHKHVTCVALTGEASAGPSGTVSIASVGVHERMVAIKLISQINTGIDVGIFVYTD